MSRPHQAPPARRAPGRATAALAGTAVTLVLAGSPAAATVPEPPLPPPVTSAPPAGGPPGPAAGLRSPDRCEPPPADDDPAALAAVASRLRLAEAHRFATGRGSLIAVIDTGVAPHPLLGDRLRGGGDYLTGDDGLDDCDGHGTAVAGLLAAGRAPGERTAGGREIPGPPIGMAPGARLLSVRQSSLSIEVTDPDGTRRPAGDVGTLAEAIVLAVRSGADVVNISEAVCLPAERAAEVGTALHAALRLAAESDVVVVAAAGNAAVAGCPGPDAAQGSPGPVSLPGWYDADILTVAAVGPDDAPAPFTVAGPWVDVAAPGTGLRSLAVDGGLRSADVAGTSFATPYVAGLAALVRERFPRLTAAQVVDRILATARRPAGSGDALGHGVIDPVAALTAVPEVLAAPADPRAATGVLLADLPGTAPVPLPEPGVPVDLLATGALLSAAALAAALLRRRPRQA